MKVHIYNEFVIFREINLLNIIKINIHTNISIGKKWRKGNTLDWCSRALRSQTRELYDRRKHKQNIYLKAMTFWESLENTVLAPSKTSCIIGESLHERMKQFMLCVPLLLPLWWGSYELYLLRRNDRQDLLLAASIILEKMYTFDLERDFGFSFFLLSSCSTVVFVSSCLSFFPIPKRDKKL